MMRSVKLQLLVTLAALVATSCADLRIEQNLPRPVLTELGENLAIHAEAGSLPELVERTGPTFTFGDRDMMWVTQDDQGRPHFTVDRAYIYRPSGQPARWVLLTLLKGVRTTVPTIRMPSSRLKYLRCDASVGESTAAELDDRMPGASALVKGRGPQGAVVYEVIWQSQMGTGSGHPVEQRRIYVLQDSSGHWRLVGEGPTSGSSAMGWRRGHVTSVGTKVDWTQDVNAPVRIRFTVKDRNHEWFSPEELATEDPPRTVKRRDRDVYTEAVLEGKLPATLRWATERPYLVAEEGDTFDGLVRHLATWTIGWQTNRGSTRQVILRMWRDSLLRLNPQLAQGAIPAGTHVRLLTYTEIIDELRGKM
jgi:hypothetical protein